MQGIYYQLIQLIGTFSLKQFENVETFGIYVLKLKKWNVAKIKNQMIKKGIFTKHGFNDAKLALNSKILQIFSDTDIKTKTQIKNILLGKNQKSICTQPQHNSWTKKLQEKIG